MKKNTNILLVIGFTFFMAACTSTKNMGNMKATAKNLTGTWTVSNISVDLPADFKVTNVFDEAPYQDFKGSTWNLIRNGNGSFSLTNGKKENIYWSIYNRGDTAQFQFKKLNGMKPKNVESGYRLQIENITDSAFVAKSPVDLGNGNTGYISYTFSK